MLCSAAPHYFQFVYEAIRCHEIIKIDSTLCTEDFETLRYLCGIEEFKPLFSVCRNDVTADMLQEPKVLDLESQLCRDNARMVAELEMTILSFPAVDVSGYIRGNM